MRSKDFQNIRREGVDNFRLLCYNVLMVKEHKLLDGTEPVEGQIVRGYAIGVNDRQLHIYAPCSVCNKLRWVQCLRNKPRYSKCSVCAGKESAKKSPYYKGGVYTSTYVYVKLDPTDEFYPMATMRGYVKRSRLIVAKRLGRCLTDEEIVHHADKNTLNDSDSNLVLCTNASEHNKEHWKDRYNSANYLYIINKKGRKTPARIKICVDCNKEQIVHKTNKSLRCHSCAKKLIHKTKGHSTSNLKNFPQLLT